MSKPGINNDFKIGELSRPLMPGMPYASRVELAHKCFWLTPMLTCDPDSLVYAHTGHICRKQRLAAHHNLEPSVPMLMPVQCPLAKVCWATSRVPSFCSTPASTSNCPCCPDCTMLYALRGKHVMPSWLLLDTLCNSHKCFHQ